MRSPAGPCFNSDCSLESSFCEPPGNWEFTGFTPHEVRYRTQLPKIFHAEDLKEARGLREQGLFEGVCLF